MKKTFRILLSTTLLGALGMLSVPAQALVKWNFVNCVGPCSDAGRTYGAAQATAGETPGDVTATGWANTEPGGTNDRLNDAFVKQYGSNGIGVVNRDQSEGSGDGQHALDNVGRFELLLFAFDDLVSVTEVGIGYFLDDADISLLAYTGAGVPNVDNVLYDDTVEGLTGAGGWELIGNFDVDTAGGPGGCVENATTNCIQDVTAQVAGRSSSYWIVAAYNPVFSGGYNEGSGSSIESLTYPDKMKVLSLAGTIDHPPPPNNQVSAPASLALLLGGIVPMLRRRRRHLEA